MLAERATEVRASRSPTLMNRRPGRARSRDEFRARGLHRRASPRRATSRSSSWSRASATYSKVVGCRCTGPPLCRRRTSTVPMTRRRGHRCGPRKCSNPSPRIWPAQARRSGVIGGDRGGIGCVRLRRRQASRYASGQNQDCRYAPGRVSSPASRARATASSRLDESNFVRTAETWCSTVRGETNSRSAI